jgi:hypothetical protein
LSEKVAEGRQAFVRKRREMFGGNPDMTDNKLAPQKKMLKGIYLTKPAVQ